MRTGGGEAVRAEEVTRLSGLKEADLAAETERLAAGTGRPPDVQGFERPCSVPNPIDVQASRRNC